jgi:hypothetical protein
MASSSAHMSLVWSHVSKTPIAVFGRRPSRPSLSYSSKCHCLLSYMHLLTREFRNAPSRAKSDLKKQLALNNVRKSITAAILAGLGLADHDMASMLSNSRSETRRPGSSMSNHPPRPHSVMSARSQGHGDGGKEGISQFIPTFLACMS